MGDFEALEPVTLPCGRIVQNRLVKPALYEHLGPIRGGPPTRHHLGLYREWAKYPWGTGNVVDPHHLTLGRDIVIPKDTSEQSIKPFSQLARAMHGENNGTLAIMQVSHAGRQSANFVGGRGMLGPPLAPSSVRMSSRPEAGTLGRVLTNICFQTPHEMTSEQIDEVVDTYVRAAVVADKAGFDGVQLHGAHGYLLAQFLSPKTNLRQDEYSTTTPENSLRLLIRIIRGIRKAVQTPQFVLGVKLNSGDYSGEDAEERVMSYIRELAKLETLDFVEISGGDYENPEFINKVQSTSPRQALFAKCSHKAMSVVSSYPSPPLIMLTGGLTSPAHLHSVLSNKHADLLGVGRMGVLRPDLPQILPNLNIDSSQPFAPVPELVKNTNFFIRWLSQQLIALPLLGAGLNVAWYNIRMRELAEGRPLQNDSGLVAMVRMQFWCRKRTYYGLLAISVLALALLIGRAFSGVPMCSNTAQCLLQPLAGSA